MLQENAYKLCLVHRINQYAYHTKNFLFLSVFDC